jgi:DNA-binding NarL/FixJ family response regulator
MTFVPTQTLASISETERAKSLPRKPRGIARPLTERESRAYLMWLDDGLTMKEIALKTGLTYYTVKAILERAKDRARDEAWLRKEGR